MPSSRADLEARIAYYATVLSESAALGEEHLILARQQLALNDLFFLMVNVLGRKDLVHPWLMDRCDEVQRNPDGYLDLWSREHYKSTIVTCGKTLQDILCNPEITCIIFSVTRPLAKKHLLVLKGWFEICEDLKALFPEICWADPKKEAPKWSEDMGLVLKRKSARKESTIEAWGLIEGLPTGGHFDLRIYDDVIDVRCVTNPDMISKATNAWEQSINLGAIGGRERYVGTRYHANDTWAEIMRRGVAKPRIYPATLDGTVSGQPAFMSREELTKRRIANGSYNFSCQYLQNPVADSNQGFCFDHLRYYDFSDGEGMNRYILVDPASSKKKGSDFTVMAVIGLSSDGNYYLLDMIRDRLNLTERGDALFALHRAWRPRAVGYEKYGAQCDIEYLQSVQRRENYRFDITPLGGQMSKEDRIKRLVPVLEENRFYLPERLIKEDYEGKNIDLVQAFVYEELLTFPVSQHDDMLDAVSRIEDPDFHTVWPKGTPASLDTTSRPDRYAKAKRKNRSRLASWLSA